MIRHTSSENAAQQTLATEQDEMNPVVQIATALQMANPLMNWSEVLGEAIKVWESYGGK